STAASGECEGVKVWYRDDSEAPHVKTVPDEGSFTWSGTRVAGAGTAIAAGAVVRAARTRSTGAIEQKPAAVNLELTGASDLEPLALLAAARIARLPSRKRWFQVCTVRLRRSRILLEI